MDLAWNVFSAGKSLYLGQHKTLVLLNSVGNDSFDKFHIALAASESDISLNKTNKALDEELLQELLVGILVLRHLCVQLGLGFFSEAFDQFVDLTHLLDALGVLLSGSLNLEVDLSVGKLTLHLFLKTLLLVFNLLLLSNGEVVLCLLVNLSNTLVSVRLDEVDH